MFKLALALMGSAAVLATPVAASAQHISSPNGPNLVVKGLASVGSNQCILTLNVTLTENGGHMSPPLYDSGINLNGTNVPAPSAPCVGIFVTGGDVELANYGVNGPGTAELIINTLEINSNPCLAAPLTGSTVKNLGTTQIEVNVPSLGTLCGPISAPQLTSISPTPVQVVP